MSNTKGMIVFIIGLYVRVLLRSHLNIKIQQTTHMFILEPSLFCNLLFKVMYICPSSCLSNSHYYLESHISI